ncbi:MAG: glycoside hydrolase family 57 protein [Candidatus Thiodiazotropha lotti]|uniref:Glycoside hydrolase family 57 protein n=1 Tax=Candidatus Thiodiazotropha lotti TaxID=2792787 RepID=A0A9E4K5L6_9GAMM|nr:glycoside hydrolase family 57 protein [Candidatus Thiodiazotropha lotti]MCG7939579.1 glycoside hydrolase family 57 protein [Candidatus Thiodiazotropha lotti]MCW4204052.1 glycoside hydrolase family 57 protein [Candidatus Thiodiazotropha lotti]MCW4219368.1 glycoside hydrolase family 57 protein [Candidatus Thiodiazotropha lotti]ODB92787.1 glycoside hydrolase [Candidatus Thiodiazotropha endoloripes]
MSDSEHQDNRLQVVFCWHMHQPYYKGPEGSDYLLPWVYLHGLKDYADMVAHLEHVPDAKAVVNFAPVLLEQIDDYSEQIAAWLKTGQLIKDPLLAALAGPGLPVDEVSRKALISACLRANEHRLISRFKHFNELADLVKHILENDRMVGYLNDQCLVDLLVWYHLAWVGECQRVNDLRVRSLQAKGRGFNSDDRRRLMELIGEVLQELPGRYAKLAKSGQVELSVTPYAHPIVPLMIDMDSAKDALPSIHMPELEKYPGGESRARWHIRKGLEVFEKHFDFRPKGCWPSEGGVSEATLKMLEEEGFNWAATGQQVLSNSLMAGGGDSQLPENWVHSAYHVQEGHLNMFFRDDGLSDLIGFTYGEWHADDAVGDLINHLVNIADACEGDPDAVVSIIMDGENAWEYYPYNGSYFLNAMYERLAEHPRLRLTTFSEVLDRQKKLSPRLSKLVAGSWVYGTFTTWIGDRDKNRAWDMLGEAKKVYDQVLANKNFSDDQLREIEKQLAICEGSDWFWWFGDYNPESTVSDFEQLFRSQLSHLFELLGEPVPDYLSEVFAVGSGAPVQGGVMKKND